MKLTDAQRLKRRIYGVIEAIATSHDGFTNGLMSPNGYAQKALISAIYKKHKIQPEHIAYIEAHGTGTKIGDPIEINALDEVLQEHSTGKVHVLLGAHKANIGHSLVASGLVGTIKVLQAMKHDMIPPQVHFSNLNPHIHASVVTVNTQKKVWPKEKSLACISNFGFGGSNAHLVLKRWTKESMHRAEEGPFLFVFSSGSHTMLQAYLKDMLAYLIPMDEKLLVCLSYTTCCLREWQTARVVFITHSVTGLRNLIEAYLISSKTSHLLQDNHKLKGQTLKAVGEKILQGTISVDCKDLFSCPHENISLPPYRFEATSYWIGQKESLSCHIDSVQSSCKTSDIIQTLKTKICDILGYKIDDLSDDTHINSLGIDSLVALQLLQPFQDHLALITPEILFQNATILDLAHALTSCLTHQSCAQTAGPNSTETSQLKWHMQGNDDGQPLILLPPLNTCHQIWIQQIRYFQRKGYQLWIPHYPGHGESAYNAISLHDLATMIGQDLKVFFPSMQNISILGWSLGGCLALLLGQNLTTIPIDKIILINSAAQFGDGLFEKAPLLRQELEDRTAYLGQLFGDEKYSWFSQISAGCSLDILKHYYEQLHVFDITAQLSKISVPCLIMFGEKDSVITVRDINILKQLPQSMVETFPHAGHFLPLTSPYAFNLAVERFIT